MEPGHTVYAEPCASASPESGKGFPYFWEGLSLFPNLGEGVASFLNCNALVTGRRLVLIMLKYQEVTVNIKPTYLERCFRATSYTKEVQKRILKLSTIKIIMIQ